MIQTAAVAIGVAVWWATACRVGQMDRRHTVAARLWHVAVGWIALFAAGQAVYSADPIALFVNGAGLVYVLATLHEWENGPPQWALRGGTTTGKHAHD